MTPGKRTSGPASCEVVHTTAVPEHLRFRFREIAEVHTPVDSRERGHATALMHSVCNEADSAGVLLLLTPDASAGDWLQAFYRKFGFECLPCESGVWVRPLDGTPRVLKPIPAPA